MGSSSGFSAFLTKEDDGIGDTNGIHDRLSSFLTDTRIPHSMGVRFRLQVPAPIKG